MDNRKQRSVGRSFFGLRPNAQRLVEALPPKGAQALPEGGLSTTLPPALRTLRNCTLRSGRYLMVLLTEPNLEGDQEILWAPVTYWFGTYANGKLYTIKICLAPPRRYIRRLARHSGKKVTIAALLGNAHDELQRLTRHPERRYVFHVEHTTRWPQDVWTNGHHDRNPRYYFLCLKPVD